MSPYSRRNPRGCPFLVVTLLLLCHVAAAQTSASQELFVNLPQSDSTLLSKAHAARLAGLEARATTAEVRLVTLADVGGLRLGHETTLNLFLHEVFEATAREVEIQSLDDFTYFGDLKYGHGSAVLVVQRGEVTGSIRTTDQLYRVVPIGKGLHAIVRVNQDAFPWDDDVAGLTEAIATKPFKIDQVGQETDLQEKIGNPKIKVLVAYTPAAANHYTNINAMIQLAVSESNWTYQNSNVGQQLELAPTVQVTYTESGSHLTDLTRLQRSNDGFMDNVHALRNQYAADVVALIIDDDSLCGRAFDIGVNATGAFVTVHHDCATGNYSFGHEIAHLQGCRHDNDSTNNPYAYAHGYVYNPGGWRTIMAVFQAGITRIPNYSNPDILWSGVATGTAATNDCARGLDTSANTVAAFRSDALSVTVDGPSWLEYAQQGNWTAIVSNAGGSISYKWFYRLEGSGFWAQVGTGSSYSRTGYENFDLKVEVTSGGQTAQDIHPVLVACEGGMEICEF